MSKQGMVYQVLIMRTNGDHIPIIESPDYDKCYERWKELHTLWTSCAKETKPFVLEEPVVTAFSPTMIYEINLVPVSTQDMASSKSNNPYQKAMHERGFSGTFPTQGRDLIG